MGESANCVKLFHVAVPFVQHGIAASKCYCHIGDTSEGEHLDIFCELEVKGRSKGCELGSVPFSDLSGISSVLCDDQVRATSAAEEVGAVECGVGGNGLCDHEIGPTPEEEIGYGANIDRLEYVPTRSNVEWLPTSGAQNVGVDLGKCASSANPNGRLQHDQKRRSL